MRGMVQGLLDRIFGRVGGSDVGDTIKVRGFIHGQIVEAKTGKIIGDTGRIRNTMMNNGLIAVAAAANAAAGSYQIGYGALGTNGTAAHNVTQTDLHSRNTDINLVAVTPSQVATGTCRNTVSFAGSDLTATGTINEAGLFKTDSAGSMFCAATFTGSQMASNQNFNLTYDLEFS